MLQSCNKLFTNFDSGLSTAYALFSACSGFLSVLSSITVLHIIWRGGKKKWCRVQNRLLVGMSVVDILYSTALSFSFIPAPRGECSFGYGTVSTCNAQGFFVQVGMALPLYVTMISLHSLLSIAYDVSEEMIARKYEPIMHALCILPPLAMATIGATAHVFFNVNGVCWILHSSWYDDNCQDNCYSWSRDVGGIILITTISLVSVSEVLMHSFLFKIYLTIRERAAGMRRFTFTPSGDQGMLRREPSSMDIAANESAKQALLYVLVHTVTSIWPLLFLFVPTEDEYFHSVIYIGTAIFLPLHGFFNFLAYIRPRFLALRRRRKDLSFLDTMKLIICASEDQSQLRRRIGLQHKRRASFPLASTDDVGNNVADSMEHISGSDEYSDDSLSKETLDTIRLAAASFGQNVAST